MRIKKLTATFGALEGSVLEPGEGLTVVFAPNEGGKSTWAAFWRAMLYGIDTRERDRAGFLADKNRYQPWSGAPMSGELQAAWQGEDVTVRRFAARGSPFGGFSAEYTASGDPVPGLTAKTVGEAFTGAGKEVYLRSAFVGQGGAFIGQSGELEARVSALATAGQEDTSFSAAQRILKDWRNRRRLNRSTGIIPQLEGELAGVDEALERTERAWRSREMAGEQITRLETERAALRAELDAWAQADRRALDRRYGEAVAAAQAARDRLDSLTPPEDRMTGWTAQEAWSWAEQREQAYESARRMREEALTERIETEQRAKGPAMAMLITALCFAGAGLVGAILDALHLVSLNLFYYIGTLMGAVVSLSARRSAKAKAEREAQAVEIPPAPEHLDWRGRAERYTDYLSRRERLSEELRHQRERAEDLAAQGAAPLDPSAPVEPPQLPKEEITARLRAAEGELARWRDELARNTGVLAQLGDPLELTARRERLQALLTERLGEYDALDTALEVLSQANDALRRRFSPALNREAGAIFTRLTGGRWPELMLARDFSAQALRGDGGPPRPALALSAGTAEQLYLAVRLAICNLALPGAPILLDDALASFDDGRMALALEYLAELGKERQILLFSCHRREADWARAHGLPVLNPEGPRPAACV